jgi:hypothetical protein
VPGEEQAARVSEAAITSIVPNLSINVFDCMHLSVSLGPAYPAAPVAANLRARSSRDLRQAIDACRASSATCLVQATPSTSRTCEVHGTTRTGAGQGGAEDAARLLAQPVDARFMAAEGICPRAGSRRLLRHDGP